MPEDNLFNWLTNNSTTKGGSGSGNFGHAGRPGKQGGSAGKNQLHAGVKVESSNSPTHPFRVGGFIFKTDAEAQDYAKKTNNYFEIMNTISDLPRQLDRQQYETVSHQFDLTPKTDNEIKSSAYGLIYGDFSPPAYTGEYAREMEINRRRLIKIEDEEKHAVINQGKTDTLIKKALDNAKSSGKPVVIRRYEEESNIPDNDVDSITEYAMPDGTVKVNRSHNY